MVFEAVLLRAPVRAMRLFGLDCFEWDQALTSQHELIGIVRDGEDVWRGLLALFASVGQHHLRVVHRQPLVRVDSDTEETRVGLRGRETAHGLLSSLAQQAFQLPKGRELLVLT